MEEATATSLGRIPRRFGRKHFVLLAVVIFFPFVIGLYLYHLHSTQLQLQSAMAEASAADPNWRLVDLEAHRREVPDAANGMVAAMAVLSLVPSPWPSWDHVPASESPQAKQAREALSNSFAELEPPAQLSDPQIKALRAELQRANKAVSEARKSIDLPYGIQRLNWTGDFFSTLLPNTQNIRQVANLLVYDILLQVQDRDFTQALRSARALLNTGRAIGDEPTLVSQLVRIAIDGLTFAKVERILAQGEPTPVELLATQRAVEQEADEPLLYYGLRGERATLDGLLENVQKGELNYQELSNLLVWLGSANALGRSGSAGNQVQERLQALTVKLTIGRQRAEVLHYMNQAVETSQLPPEQQAARLQEMESIQPKDLPLLIRLLGPAWWKVGKAANRIRAQLRCTAVALAAERYRQARGRWPTRLSELVPEYLAVIPLDPFNGQVLKLAKRDQGIVIYSVGQDGIDNGGVINARNPPGSDIGFRLWDLKHRRQPAPPFKSSAEE
jgi:hypothetical protein